MPLSARCKKCGTETASGAICPRCGGKLGNLRWLWRVERRPVLSWIGWNTPMRVILPGITLMAAAVAAAELIGGGAGAVERLLSGDLPRLLLILTASALALTGLVLVLRGREVLEIAAEKSGLTVTVLLPKPNAVSLLLRLRSPRLAADTSRRREYGLLLEERKLPWKEIRRVQIWAEKSLVLLYAPSWWLRLAVPCDQETWPEIRQVVTERLGRQKNTRLPEVFRPAGDNRQKKHRPAQQMEMGETASIMDIEAMNAEAEQESREDWQTWQQ